MRWPLAGERTSVMAAVAALRREIRLTMIHDHERATPCGHARTGTLVASLANIRRIDMRCRLGCRANTRRMAEHAVIYDSQFFMSERRRNPARRCMAQIARGAGGNVVRGLTNGVGR